MDVKWIDGVIRALFIIMKISGGTLYRDSGSQTLMEQVEVVAVGAYARQLPQTVQAHHILATAQRASAQAKYSSRPVVARKIARRFARELSLDGFFDGIDMIVPVPLHRWKLMRRGYNQSDYIARGIADVTGIEVSHSLVASRGHATQTARNSYQRWVNAGSVYELRDGASVAGRHVLLVDDVITTGATLLACCEAIHRVEPSARLSVLALGVAHMS